MELQQVSVVSDGDSHMYVIPFAMTASFHALLKVCEKLDEYDEFEEVFGRYRLGGDLSLITLYAHI